jgi:pimeloyl-ACP methyl ester carboxylesterase
LFFLDAASIIKEMKIDKAVVAGRSGGAVIGLELAATRPDLIDFLIVHEAPVINLLPKPKAQRWRSFVDEIYTKSQREGWQAAQTEFMASLINVPDKLYPPDLNERLSGNMDFFFNHEFKAFHKYQPKLEGQHLSEQTLFCLKNVWQCREIRSHQSSAKYIDYNY